MKQTFIICAAIAVIGAITNLILGASGGKNFSKIINLFLSVILIFAFLKTPFEKESLLEFDLQHQDSAKLNSNFFKEAVKMCEEDIENIILSDLENEFKVSPINVSVKINSENFEIEKTSVSFARSDALISSYAIKEYIKSKYQIDAEVYFV